MVRFKWYFQAKTGEALWQLPINGPAVDYGDNRAGLWGHRSYFCPRTGVLWAMAICEVEEFPELPQLYTLIRRCQPGLEPWFNGDRPGSLVHTATDLFLLPRQLLERELLLK